MDTSQLTQDITDKENELKALKIMQAALKKEEKKNRLFSQTKVGSALYKAARSVTDPFVRLNLRINDELTKPEEVVASKFLEKAIEFTNKSTALTQKEDGSIDMAVRLASHIMETEDFMTQYHFSSIALCSVLEKMKSEVERLRPPKDPEKEQQLKDTIGLISTLLDEKKEVAHVDSE